jgi:hypothetical protein
VTTLPDAQMSMLELDSSSSLLHANSTMVAKAWAASIPELDGIVGTSLPDISKWASSGFVTVGPVFPGTPGRYLPERGPVITFDAWAANARSKKVPWGRANNLAEILVNATYRDVPAVTMPAGFKPVFLEMVYPVSEVREVPEPQSNYAHYSVDIFVGWIEQNPDV